MTTFYTYPELTPIGFAVRTRHICSLLGELMWYRDPPYLKRFSVYSNPLYAFAASEG